jgi:hypothetical protein
MFDSNHYVPVLRWKAAEKEALKQMSLGDRKSVTPLIELMMPRPELYKGNTKKERDERKEEKSPTELLAESVELFKQALPKVPEDISKCWGDNPLFVDVRFVDGSIRAQALEELLSLGKQHNLFMIPVVNMIPIIDLESDKHTRDIAVKYAKEGDHGLCLRLLRSNLIRKETLEGEIKKFLEATGLIEGKIDLIADFGVADAEYDVLVDSLGEIPHLKAWRSFAVLSGAFPQDLTEYKLGDNRTDRLDWNNWVNPKTFAKLARKPAFGDYTLQCPTYKEPPRISFPSASIRYTAGTQYIVMRGQGGPDKESKQYLANAQLLTGLSEFDGADFSYGDAYIAEKAKDLTSSKTGSPTTWLVAGINHHLAKVVSQISTPAD